MRTTKSPTHYERLAKNPQTFRMLTGVTVEKFLWLKQQLKPLYKAWNENRLMKRKRRRKIGGGNQFRLCLGDKLLMTLMYYRLYTTGCFLGFVFGMDESNTGRNRNPIEKLLAQIFRIPEAKIELEENEILAIFYDGTEQPINRPKKGQKKHYSGKKKRHTIKHQIVVAKKKVPPGGEKTKERLRIVSVSKAFCGKTHDKKMYDETKVQKPPDVDGMGDQAYIGTVLVVPHKKPKKKELSEEQKAYNRKHSSERICVEHAIGKMKIWRVASEKYRHKRAAHDLMMKNIAGLHNLMFA